MNRDQQIEEMAQIIAENTEFDTMWDEIYASAKALYNAGYRKASEVAREFIKAVDSMLELVTAMTGLNVLAYGGKFAELKKKYTEEGK